MIPLILNYISPLAHLKLKFSHGLAATLKLTFGRYAFDPNIIDICR